MKKISLLYYFHLLWLLSRAVGGAGLIIMEMTDVDPDGRISDYDLGLWTDEQIPAFKRIVSEVHKYGTKIGIQIAHAGRKAEDAEQPVGPSAIPAGPRYKTPRPLTVEEIQLIVKQFKEAARRAVEAGVDTIEIHGAHGYLVHQFHSPGINNRKDEYGQNPARFGVEVIQAVKSVMPADMPLIIRISAIEYMENGYDLNYGIEMSKQYHAAGADVFHVSSGGEGGPAGKLQPGNYPGYQVPFARAIKEALNVPVIAVGMLDDPKLAEAVVANEDADLVAVARGLLRDPYWALHAIQAVKGEAVPPKQYGRAY